MKPLRDLFYFSLFCLTFGCNQNGKKSEKIDKVNPVVVVKAQKVDTLNFETQVSFQGVVKLSRFGNPGVAYSEKDSLPNLAYILETYSPKSFYYKDDMDSISYSFYKQYNQYQLTSKDSLINQNLSKFLDKKVSIDGNIFKGLTMHYIRELAIDIKKINNIK